MKLSIVTTLFNSFNYVEEFCCRSGVAARHIAGDDYEIVLVNDGSPDKSLELAIHLSETDPHIVVVDLSRNFGHHKALMTGLRYSCGDLVFLIDSDLEEEPEWLLGFHSQMSQQQCDVVYGVQKQRKGGVIERWSGRVFYEILRVLSRLDLPNNIVVARLMTRRYVQGLLQHDEREIFIAGLWACTGFEQCPQTILKHSTSKTTYTLRLKISQLINSITSFSNTPLIGIFVIGCLMSLISGLYSVFLIVNWLFLAVPPSGWTSVIASIWLLGGMIIAFIGIIGIYISKIFSETKRRPNTIVRQLYGKSGVRETH